MNSPILTYTEDADKKQHIYVLQIPYSCVGEIKFTAVDNQTLAACKQSDSIADKVLGIHLLLSRLFEGRKTEAERKAKLPKIFVPRKNGSQPSE